jgi:hypothetical protein
MSAERTYRLTVHELAGLTVFEATGSFTHADVWELVGEKTRVATFAFARGSGAIDRFGPSVVGVPLYTPRERAARASNCGPTLRIDVVMRDASKDAKRQLEHLGVGLEDIAAIHVLPFDRSIERHESGEKKIPNVIEIPYEHDPRVNVDRLTQSFLITKNNHGVELAPFEKEQLIGITLGLNDGQIDRRIIEHFGFTVESARDSPEVCYHRLEAKARQGKSFTEHEAQQLDDLRAIRRTAAIIAVLKELQSCRLEGALDGEVRSALNAVLEAVSKFRPSVLVNGKRQVYWDLYGYVHIALGHIRDMQIGSLANKTPFPYRASDLEMLIEKVLATVMEEIHAHFDEQPDQVFYRAGARSVYFHGDYYSFHIDPGGRLTNFHPLSPEPGESAHSTA